VFGTGDDIGTVNLLTPARVLRALAEVHSGEVINLDHPLDAFDPPLARMRESHRHVIFAPHADSRDDRVDNLYMQSASQLDGLRHRRDEVFGFYNGVPDEAIVEGTPVLGVNRWVEHGIVGRGVLADVAGLRDARSRPLDHRGGEPFGVDAIEAALEAQGSELLDGDILLVRTGFARHYFDQLSDAERRNYGLAPASAGLIQSHATVGWLWDRRIALLATDNLAVEAVPAVSESPFVTARDHGLMHQQLLARLGLALGELWALDVLAERCRARGSHAFFVTCKPLHLVGGVGSPANALAVL
jgi:kynurenine formamidase